MPPKSSPDLSLFVADGSRFPHARQLVESLGEGLQSARSRAGNAPLTPAELRLAPWLATQLTFAGIAERLFLSMHTVKAQVTSIYRKLGVTSRTQAVERLQEAGLIDRCTRLAVGHAGSAVWLSSQPSLESRWSSILPPSPGQFHDAELCFVAMAPVTKTAAAPVSSSTENRTMSSLARSEPASRNG